MTQALYYDGGSPRGRAVTLDADAQHLRVRGDGVEFEAPLQALGVTSRLGRVRRVIQLAGNAQLHCDDNDWIDAHFVRRGVDALIDPLERHEVAVAVSVLTTALCLVALILLGLPWLAERAAKALPETAEATLGRGVLQALDKAGLAPTGLPEERQKVLRKIFEDFVSQMPDARRYSLAFRRIPDNAANAFAIPGGTIVVTDGLVAALPDPDAFLAVVAHELGHQVEHHAVRSVLQGSVVVVIASIFTSDVGSTTSLAFGLPAFLLTGSYSRDFEREADRYATDALRSRGISPEWFAYSLAIIDRDARKGDAVDAYTSSHPPSSERIAAARAQASDFGPLENAAASAMAEAYGRGAGRSEADQAGCWRGRKALTQGRHYRWFARFEDDGRFDLRFDYYGPDDAWERALLESGRWTIRDGIMTTRLLSRGVPGSDPEVIDEMLSYRFRELESDFEAYESVPGGIAYTSQRVACGIKDSKTAE